MSYTIQLEQFEGPLDVLLQLIQREELDITEVSLAKIADQYLEYINTVELPLIEVADFLNIASRLLYIKSHIVLPQAQEVELEDEIDLTKQLRLYQQYVQASDIIATAWTQPIQLFHRDHSLDIMTEGPSFVTPENVSIDTLQYALRAVLLRIQPVVSLPEKTIRKIISLRQRIKDITLLINTRMSVLFHELVDSRVDKHETIVNFLAILELVKQRELGVQQSELFADITITKIT